MSSRDDEVRRLERLRQEQLAARDPTAKQRKRTASMTRRYRKAQKRITIGSILKDMGAKWLLMFIGLTVGVLIAILINIVAPGEPWTSAVSWICIAFFTVGGRILGSIRDWGDEDWTPKR